MPRLTQIQRGRAIAMLMDGHNQTAVARQFGVALCTINRLETRFHATGLVFFDRPRRGRLRVMTERFDCRP